MLELLDLKFQFKVIQNEVKCNKMNISIKLSKFSNNAESLKIYITLKFKSQEIYFSLQTKVDVSLGVKILG